MLVVKSEILSIAIDCKDFHEHTLSTDTVPGIAKGAKQ
jgi:hypothetical protein